MHGLPARTDDDWLQGLGTPLTVQFADWGSDPETLQALIATYRTYNLEHHDRMVTVYPGIVEAVQAIRAAVFAPDSSPARIGQARFVASGSPNSRR